ncbi:hypothetical protein ACOMHN_012138 [Nucella lapillus]
MASSPSVSQYPPGVQLPHEPGPPGGDLPPGEGCYDCDHDFGDLPLAQPYTPRSKRSVTEKEEGDLDSVVSQFQQREARERAMPAGEVIRARRSADPYYSWRHAQRTSSSNASAAVARPRQLSYDNQTMVLRLRQRQSRPKVRIIKVLPSMAALANNTRCTIVSGDPHHVFSMHQRRGITSLHFTRRLKEPAQFLLHITCQPLTSDVHLAGTHLHLHLHPDSIRLLILVQ